MLDRLNVCALCLFGEFCAHVSPIEHISGRTFFLSFLFLHRKPDRDQTLRLAFSVQFINALVSMDGISFFLVGCDSKYVWIMCSTLCLHFFMVCFNGIWGPLIILNILRNQLIFHCVFRMNRFTNYIRIRKLLLCINNKPMYDDRMYKGFITLIFGPCIFVLNGLGIILKIPLLSKWTSNPE